MLRFNTHCNFVRFVAVVLCSATLFFACSDVALARKAKVSLKNGRDLVGTVVAQDTESITLEINSIKNKIQLKDVKVNGIEFLQTPVEEYKIRRAELKDEDITGRYKLAYWLYQQKEYKLAKTELDDLAARAPTNNSVTLLRNVVKGKLKEVGNGTGTSNPNTNPNGNTNGSSTGTGFVGPLPTKRLDTKMINKLRVMEIDLKAKPRITIPRNVLIEFLKEYAESEEVPRGRDLAKFKSTSNATAQLQLMFQLRAREFYDKVIVRDDPPVFREWRIIHRNYLQSHCATANCHGGKKAGRLFLFNKQPTSEETAYTNFYIADRFENKQGLLVDRDYPKDSLLITYGFARSETTKPHPDVPGFKPAFVTGQRDKTYGATLKWVTTLYRPKPKYQLDYVVPTLKSVGASKVAPKPEPLPGKSGASEK
jgi:hypothetical protein